MRIISMDNAVEVADAIDNSTRRLMSQIPTKPTSLGKQGLVCTPAGNWIRPVAR